MQVHGDKAFDAALQENLRVGVQQFLVVMMSDGEKEKILLAEMAFDSTDDHGGVSVAEIPSDYADRVGALHA